MLNWITSKVRESLSEKVRTGETPESRMTVKPHEPAVSQADGLNNGLKSLSE